MSGVKGKSGVYVRTKEYKEKMSQFCKGKSGVYKHHPQQGFQKGHQGFKAMLGKHPSKETLEKMSNVQKGEKGSNYKGGKWTSQRGYIYILMPEHPYCKKSGYIKRATLVMEKMLGRYLIPPELTHHKGIKYPIGSIENRQDDRPENLQLFKNNSKHTKFHWEKCGKIHRPK